VTSRILAFLNVARKGFVSGPSFASGPPIHSHLRKGKQSLLLRLPSFRMYWYICAAMSILSTYLYNIHETQLSSPHRPPHPLALVEQTVRIWHSTNVAGLLYLYRSFQWKPIGWIKNNKINKHMVASVSFVSTGTFNHVFPSLSMHTLLSSKFPRETGIFSWKQRISLSSNFPCMLDEGYLGDKSVPHYLWLESCTSSKIIGTTMDSIWRHRPVHIRTITLPALPKTNEHGDVFLRVRIYEKCSYHNHKTIKQHSKQATHHARFPQLSCIYKLNACFEGN
jgi:hypothetical protein